MSRTTRSARPTEAPDSPGDSMPLEGGARRPILGRGEPQCEQGAGEEDLAAGLALRENIARVTPVAAQDARIIEVHPEVSFRALVGGPLQFAKTSWNGQMIRRQRLATAGIEMPDVPIKPLQSRPSVGASFA